MRSIVRRWLALVTSGTLGGEGVTRTTPTEEGCWLMDLYDLSSLVAGRAFEPTMSYATPSR